MYTALHEEFTSNPPDLIVSDRDAMAAIDVAAVLKIKCVIFNPNELADLHHPPLHHPLYTHHEILRLPKASGGMYPQLEVMKMLKNSYEVARGEIGGRLEGAFEGGYKEGVFVAYGGLDEERFSHAVTVVDINAAMPPFSINSTIMVPLSRENCEIYESCPFNKKQFQPLTIESHNVSASFLEDLLTRSTEHIYTLASPGNSVTSETPFQRAANVYWRIILNYKSASMISSLEKLRSKHHTLPKLSKSNFPGERLVLVESDAEGMLEYHTLEQKQSVKFVGFVELKGEIEKWEDIPMKKEDIRVIQFLSSHQKIVIVDLGTEHYEFSTKPNPQNLFDLVQNWEDPDTCFVLVCRSLDMYEFGTTTNSINPRFMPISAQPGENSDDLVNKIVLHQNTVMAITSCDRNGVSGVKNLLFNNLPIICLPVSEQQQITAGERAMRRREI
tara:strand:+ start:145 stop:1476 length:1332 start_codon:yes stop_codon:yes gene_type:complete